MPIKKERNLFWDNIKGILIILVVFAHFLYQSQHIPLIENIVDVIYLFHMPAFVFVSGYLGKSENSHSGESIIKLLFLYFIFNGFFSCVYQSEQLLIPMYSMWYLLALAFWRAAAPRLSHIKYIQLILIAGALFVGYYPCIDNTFAASRIICFFPFYMWGYNMSAEQMQTLKDKKLSRRLGEGLLYLIAFCAAVCVFTGVIIHNSNDLLMMPYSDLSGAAARIIILISAYCAIKAILSLGVSSKIPLLTSFGRNSLGIFLLHRPVTLIISEIFVFRLDAAMQIILSLILTFLVCQIFGNDLISRVFNGLAESAVNLFDKSKDGKGSRAAAIALAAVLLPFVFTAVMGNMYKALGNVEEEVSEKNVQEDIIYPIMTDEQAKKFDEAFRLTFAGDLILLEDQVKLAYKNGEYDFSPVFEYSKEYISSADYAIGVFEGPMAGQEKGYSSSNYDDGKTLALNYPDSFGQAVKDAGFDLVSAANNHLLDKGIEGAIRTIDTLDAIGLEHTGAYRSAEEKESSRVKVVNCGEITMAVLSYTYGFNNFDTNAVLRDDLSYLTSIITGTEGDDFEYAKLCVEKDFELAKQSGADLIVVLPHIGTQFLNQPDEQQLKWFEIFKENGADIILGDHSHAIQPAEIVEYNGKNVFTAYCPGNFANIYREYKGDTSALIDVYIDRDTKQVIGGSVVPLYTQASADGNYRALPVYETRFNQELRKTLSTDDLVRSEEALTTVTDVVLGYKMGLSDVQPRYYFDSSGYIRRKIKPLDITEKMKGSRLYKALSQSQSVCFIGDSVTEGTKNGGCPWYEPIESAMKLNVYNFSKGSTTVSYFTQRSQQIPKAELYVIALGTNDVRYRDPQICAMTAEDYTAQIGLLKESITAQYGDVKFAFIAPWYSVDGDKVSSLHFSDKTKLNDEYSAALERYCSETGDIFVDANTKIRETLETEPHSSYLLDHIHPNSTDGVMLYSAAALSD